MNKKDITQKIKGSIIVPKTIAFITIILIFFSIFFTAGFFEGIQNLDTGWNLEKLSCVFNSSLVDKSNGIESSPTQLIDRGYYMIKLNFLLGILSMFLLGMYIFLN